MKRIAIIGGGLSGLTAAYELTRLQQAGADLAFTLFEASGRLGGTIETVRQDGFAIECGPDGWVSDKPWARDLALELGLADELLPSNDRTRKTHILHRDRLLAIPDGMRMMVPTDLDALDRSPLFSPAAIRAYRAEPGRAAELLARIPGHDESVASFTLRHFGREVLSTIAAPLLSGVFGGDVHRLSARAVLAPFVALERTHGSLILGLQARNAARHGAPIPTQPTPGASDQIDASDQIGASDQINAGGQTGGGDQILAVGELDVNSADTRSPTPSTTAGPQSLFTTLRSGLGTLTDTLAAHLLPASLRRHTRVVRLEHRAGRWLVHTLTAPQTPSQSPPAGRTHLTPAKVALTPANHQASPAENAFDAVLLATPLPVTRALLAPLDEHSARLLPTNASSAIIVALAWKDPRLPSDPALRGAPHLPDSEGTYAASPFIPPAGFGFLVPPARGLRALTAPRLLATTFVEQKFAHRAPPGARLLRAFFGGIGARSLRHAPDNFLIQLALRELADILGPLPVAPPLTVVRRWPSSLPQYEVGHLDRVAALESRLAHLPGLHLLGNALHGVGLPDLIRDARALARSLAELL